MDTLKYLIKLYKNLSKTFINKPPLYFLWALKRGL